MSGFNPLALLTGIALHANPVAGIALDVAESVISTLPIAQQSAARSTAKAAANQVLAKAPVPITVTPVKSVWTSKINWMCLLGVALAIPGVFNRPVDPTVVDTVTQFASVGLFPLIALVRTFFTRSVLKPSTT